MGSHKDLKNQIQVAHGISATLSGATPVTGNIIDLTGYEAATFVYQTGQVTDAGDATGVSVEIQESDTTAAADFTAVSDNDLIGTEEALRVTDDTHDSKPVGAIGYKVGKRYVRAKITGSTGSNAVVNGIWVKHAPHVAPIESVAANISAT